MSEERRATVSFSYFEKILDKETLSVYNNLMCHGKFSHAVLLASQL